MTDDDVMSEQPEHRIAMAVQGIHSCLFDIAEWISRGEGDLIRNEFDSLAAARIQIDNILTYLQLHQRAA